MCFYLQMTILTEKAITFSEGEILDLQNPNKFIKSVMWRLLSMKLLLSTCFHV